MLVEFDGCVCCVISRRVISAERKKTFEEEVFFQRLNLIPGEGLFCLVARIFFNELPLNIADAESTQTFCRRARHFFLS